VRTDIKSFAEVNKYTYTVITIVQGITDKINNMKEIVFCGSVPLETILMFVKKVIRL
jgi:hypothetical protein